MSRYYDEWGCHNPCDDPLTCERCGAVVPEDDVKDEPQLLCDSCRQWAIDMGLLEVTVDNAENEVG